MGRVLRPGKVKRLCKKGTRAHQEVLQARAIALSVAKQRAAAHARAQQQSPSSGGNRA